MHGRGAEKIVVKNNLPIRKKVVLLAEKVWNGTGKISIFMLDLQNVSFETCIFRLKMAIFNLQREASGEGGTI